MRNRCISRILTGILLMIIAAMAGCKASSPVTAVSTLVASATTARKTSVATATEAQPYPQPVLSPTRSPTEQKATPTREEVSPTATATNPAEYSPTPEPTTEVASIAEVSPTPTVGPPTPTTTATASSLYPGPIAGQGEEVTQAYPGPEVSPSPTSNVSPTPGTSVPKPTQTPTRSSTPTTQLISTVYPSPTSSVGTGVPQVTPSELPPRRPISPPPAGSNITIWYSWGSDEAYKLKEILESFQSTYPNVTFDLLFVPLDDLFGTYQEAAYYGKGPDLLLGPAQWGPALFKEQLITDLEPYVPSDYLSTINPAALASGTYNQSIISLPLSQHGVVMYRNTSIIASPPETFDDLVRLAHQATHAGIVGSYLERGAYFSSADIVGLGGGLLDNIGEPAFNSQAGLDWINLLHAYDDAGAVTFNSNWDLDKFKKNKVGIIIDGTWNLPSLVASLGSDHLAIDPWPTYGNGHMSGWVQADSVFLNANTTGDGRTAALAFMGFLLDPNVQIRLAEVGHIPVVMSTKPRDPLIQQAMEALFTGTPYPISVDEGVLSLYWTSLNSAIRDVFVNHVGPTSALKSASNDIQQGLINLQTSP